ncbi:MAG: SOS response-associated peptidase [Pseudomonadota bacterium]
MTLKFDRTDLSLERQVRRLDLHDNWPTSALDLADIEDGAQDRIELVCNLYSNTTAVEAMRRLFDIDAGRDRLGNAEPRPAIFPKGAAPVVRLNDTGERELVEMAWGFLTPAFSTKAGNPIKPKAWNNARDDKVLKSGLWKGSFQERRCLIPVSSFHESKGRQPATDYWFGLHAENPEDRPPFAVAGLWRIVQSELRSASSHELTHTMVTTEANDMIRPIHAKGRMPVILDPENYDAWLSGSTDDALALLRPYPSTRMRIIQNGVGLKADPLKE